MCRKEVKMRMSHVAEEVHFKNEWRKQKKGKENCHLARNLVRSCNLQTPLPSNSRSSLEDFPVFALDEQGLFQDLRTLGECLSLFFSTV